MDTAAAAGEMTRLQVAHYRAFSRLQAAAPRQGETGVLLCLHMAGRALLAGEIMDRTGLTTGHVANILRQLEAKGLILRLQDREDKRRVRVSLTDAGRAAAETVRKECDAGNARLLGWLGAEDGKTLVRLLRRMLLSAEQEEAGG